MSDQRNNGTVAVDALLAQVATATSGEAPAGAVRGRKPLFQTLGELMSEAKPTAWLIRDLLEQECLATFFGESGSMKSFLALDLGLCVSTGKTWHGHEIGKQGPVFYICGEGRKGISKRVRAWALEHNTDVSKTPFYVSERAIAFLDSDDLDNLMWSIDEVSKSQGTPALIIIDTLARNFGPGDENSNRDMGAFVAAMDKLKFKYKCAVVAVHHVGNGSKDRERGAYALRASMDFSYIVERRAAGISVAPPKVKDQDDSIRLFFEPVVREVGITDDYGRPETSVVLRLGENKEPVKRGKPLTHAKRIALETLEALAVSGPVPVAEWRQEAYRKGISPSEERAAKKKAFQRAVGDLLKLNLISVDDDHYIPLSTGGQRGQGGQQGDMGGQMSRPGEGDIGGQYPLGLSPLSPLSPSTGGEQ